MAGIGRITLAVALVVTGLGLLAHNLQLINGMVLFRWWPVLLILLGVEMVVRGRGDQQRRLDGFSIFLILVLVGLMAFTGWISALLPPDLVDWARINLPGGGLPWWTGPARVAHQENRELNQAITPGTTTLRIDQQFANVNVIPAAADEPDTVTAMAAITGWGNTEVEARRAAASFSLNVREQGDTMVLTLDDPQKSRRTRPSAVGLTVAVPSHLDVVIVNNFGRVDVRDLAGKVQITSEFGDVKVTNVSGPIDVISNFGDIHVLLPEDADAAVQISTDFGDLNVEGVIATVNRSGPTASSQFQVGRGGIPITIHAKFGDIRILVARPPTETPPAAA